MSGELQEGRDLVYVTGTGYQTTSDNVFSTVLTANASSHVFGSWVEIMRAQQDLWIVGTFLSLNSTPVTTIREYSEIELGMGESGSEYTIWQAKTHGIEFKSAAADNYYRMEWLRRYIKLLAGQRIAARHASDFGGTDVQLALSYVYDIDLKVMR